MRIPSILLGIAAFILWAAYLMYRPDAVYILGPADLRNGAVSRADFTAPYSGSFAIGVRMDQAKAFRLAPCIADPETLMAPHCREAKSRRASLTVIDRSGRSLPVTLDQQYSGGKYSGTGYFTWEAAIVNLKRGSTYKLRFQSIARLAPFDRARPQLTIWDARAGILAEAGLIRLLATLLAGIFAIAGLTMFVRFVLTRRQCTYFSDDELNALSPN